MVTELVRGQNDLQTWAYNNGCEKKLKMFWDEDNDKQPCDVCIYDDDYTVYVKRESKSLAAYYGEGNPKTYYTQEVALKIFIESFLLGLYKIDED